MKHLNEEKVTKLYMVVLDDGSCGTIYSDVNEGSELIAQTVTVNLRDENGGAVEIEGVVTEVLQ